MYDVTHFSLFIAILEVNFIFLVPQKSVSWFTLLQWGGGLKGAAPSAFLFRPSGLRYFHWFASNEDYRKHRNINKKYNFCCSSKVVDD